MYSTDLGWACNLYLYLYLYLYLHLEYHLEGYITPDCLVQPRVMEVGSVWEKTHHDCLQDDFLRGGLNVNEKCTHYLVSASHNGHPKPLEHLEKLLSQFSGPVVIG